MDHGMDERALTDVPAEARAFSWAESTCALIESRQTVLPKRLQAPGPDTCQLQQIVSAAAAAPDHGELLPWRFVIVPEHSRGRLGDVFAAALIERDAQATPTQIAQAREKAMRAPLLMLAVAKLAGARDDVPSTERLVSLGCAIQNMLLVATAQGFGSALTSGKSMDAPGLHALFGLEPHERAICFINVGTAASRKPRRQRPEPHEYVSTLGDALP
jgi:nitroreductase